MGRKKKKGKKKKKEKEKIVMRDVICLQNDETTLQYEGKNTRKINVYRSSGYPDLSPSWCRR
jgi:hypothetical protein